MAAEKKKQSIDFTLSGKFIRSLAKELVSDSERGFSLASSTQGLEDALQKSADSLPGGKLRSTLLSVLQQGNQKNAFVAALKNNIRVLSAKLDLRSDVLLTPPASDRLFEALVSCIRGKGASPFANISSKDVFSHEDMQLLLSQDPAPHIFWALAAVKLSSIDGPNSAMDFPGNGAYGIVATNVTSLTSSFYSLAFTLLHCLKPWIVGRNASVALATLAPVVPLVLESLKQSKAVRNIKDLRTLVKEVLSFIVALNYKEQFMQGSLENGSRGTPLFPYLFDGFWAVYKSLRLDDMVAQMEGLSTTEKLNLMFPLASGLVEKAMKPLDARVGVVAEIVKVEFVLLHMVLELIYCRQKAIVGLKLVDDNHIDILREQAGSMAVSGVTAVQHDLLLDVLLSDSVVSNLLDGGEWALVRFSVFKALLMAGGVFCKTCVDEPSARNRKALEIFFKRLAVARKISASQRLPNDTSETLGGYLKAPHKLFDYVKSCEVIRKLPEQGLRNDKSLIGWLLRLDDATFQAVVERTSFSDPQADEKVDFKREDLSTKSSVNRLSLRDTGHQSDVESLFFVDTTGDEKGQDDDNPPNAHRKSRKRKKRKERQVLFHRQGHVTKKKEEECLSEGSSDSSLDMAIDDHTVVREERANEGYEGSAG